MKANAKKVVGNFKTEIFLGGKTVVIDNEGTRPFKITYETDSYGLKHTAESTLHAENHSTALELFLKGHEHEDLKILDVQDVNLQLQLV